jgi:predicted lipoprotein with Yx(FWY)xxD motif
MIAVISVFPALVGCSAVAVSRVPVRVEGNSLVDLKGMTLYVYDRDLQAKSTCSGQCAANWQPFVAAAEARPAGDYSIVRRDDGGRQWAYKGRPLYSCLMDRAPGDRAGDGFNNLWRTAKP